MRYGAFLVKGKVSNSSRGHGRGQKDFFPQLLGTVEKAGAERRGWGWRRPTAGAGTTAVLPELKAAVQLLGQALIVHLSSSSHTQNVQTESRPNP